VKGKPAAAAAAAPALPGDRDTPEVLLVLGQNRWRAGTSTKGYVSAYFYAELPATFTGTLPFAFDPTSDVALYSPIGVPNTDSPSSNAPANTEPRIHASMYWDDGIPIPPQAFVGGALLEIELYGALKVGRPGTLHLVIDPDGDVRLDARGDNLTLASERMKVLGAESGVRTHVAGIAQNAGGIVQVLLPAHGLSNGELVWLSAGDRTRGIQPDLLDGGWYHAIVLDADHFQPSTTPPAAPTFVTWVPDEEAPELVVTRSTSSGSWKQVKFAFALASNTLASDFQPFRLRLSALADGRGASDTEDGVWWFAELETFEVCDRIGTSATTVAASEGAPTARRWAAAASRTSPGRGQANATTIPTAAPLLLASNDFDGLGTKAYLSSAHDYGGQWDEIGTSVDLVAPLPFVSVTNAQTHVQATSTLLFVGDEPRGEVTAVLNGRRLVRYRPFDPLTRIRRGENVRFQVYRRVGNAWSAVTGATGTFVAGAIRIGPQVTQLALRAAMDGRQDGTNVLDVRGGVARLWRNWRR
jgi:hypothetical protein